MKLSLRAIFSGLPRLETHLARLSAIACKICGSDAAFFDVVDFNKSCEQKNFYRFGRSGIGVAYFRCYECHYMFTDFFDDWQPEDFSAHVYNADYIKVDPEYVCIRPERVAADMREMLSGFEMAAILDYGSGSGIFVDRLSSFGFADVTAYDPYSCPRQPNRKFDIITCFEVLEHSTDPITTLGDIASLLNPSGIIVFSQNVQPRNISDLRGNWWYVGPRNGHVSFFSLSTLFSLAEMLGFQLWVGNNIYCFSRPDAIREKRTILEHFTARYTEVMCMAPPSTAGVSAQWQGCERTTSFVFGPYTQSEPLEFRWTSSSEIGFPISLEITEPTIVEIRIPCLMAITPDFAEQCRVVVNNIERALEATDESLCATFQLEKCTVERVTLVTPEPVSPLRINGLPDDRSLGIAIPTKWRAGMSQLGADVKSC